MRTTRVLAVVAWLGAVAHPGPGSPALAADAPRRAKDAPRGDPYDAAAVAALAAFRAKDDAGLAYAAESSDGDPIALAAALLARYPNPDADALDAAARLAALVATRPRAAGLERLVTAWRRWDAAALARERALAALRSKADAEGLTETEVAAARAAEGSPAAVGALLAHALRLRRAGADQASVGALRAALEAAGAMPWPMAALRTRRELAQALLLRDLDREALAEADRGLSEAAALEATDHVGMLQRARAGALLGLDRPDEALEAIESAYVGRTSAWSTSVEAQRSGILSRLGRRAEAVALGERVLEAQRRDADAAGVAVALNNLASYEAREGRLARAITYADRALEALATAPSSDQVRRLRATALHNRAAAHRLLDDPDRAIADFEAAEALRRDLGMAAAADRSAAQRALALEHRGRLAEALALQRALGERARARGNPRAQADADAHLIRLLQALGQGEAARAHAEAAVERARTAHVEGEGRDRLEIVAAFAAADPAAALARVDGYLAARGVGMQSLAVASAEATRAELARRLGRLDDAAAAMRRCLDRVRAASAGLGDHDAGGTLRRARRLAFAFEVAQGRLERSTDDAGRRAVLDDALHASEATRAIRLQDGLLNRGALLAARAPLPSVRAEREARRRLDEALDAARRLGPATTPMDAARVRDGVVVAEAALDQASARLRRELRFGAEAVPSPVVGLEPLTRALGASRLYVAYERVGEDLVALVVGARGGALVPIGPATALAERVDAWLDQLASGADDRALAASLYDALVRPFEDHLVQGGRLLVAPDATLARLPFGALLRAPPSGKSERLLERVSVAFVASASTWRLLDEESARTTRGTGVLAVGRPRRGDHDGLADLPESEAEARRVAMLYPEGDRTLLLGVAATRRAFVAALARERRWAAVHFAGHARMDADHPNLSALVLADGERVGLDDLTEGGVSAELVVLSACETGLGADALGEGAAGFPRRLFLAGCPRVVVTAWPIADGAGTDLLVDFHAQLYRGNASAATALAAAQRARLAAGEPPAAWAPFLLWGLDD